MDTQTGAPACSTNSMGPKLSERIWLEVGHAYQPRRGRSDRAAQDWRVWVRGCAGADIAALVHKVVFQLRPENLFPYPERVFDEPPYQVQKSGTAPTEVLITVHLKCTTKPERIRLQYGPLFNNADQSSAASRCIFYDVQNPSEQLQMALMKSQTSAQDSGRVLVVVPDSCEVHPPPEMLQTSTIMDKNKCTEPVEAPLQHKQILMLKGSLRQSNPKKTPKASALRNCSVLPASKICPQLKQSNTESKSYEFVEPIDPKLWESMKPAKDSSKYDNLMLHSIATTRKSNIKGVSQTYSQLHQKSIKRKVDEVVKPIDSNISQKKIKLAEDCLKYDYSMVKLPKSSALHNSSGLVNKQSQQKTTEGKSYEFVEPIDSNLWENMKLPASTSKRKSKSKSSASNGSEPVSETCFQSPHRTTNTEICECSKCYDSRTALKNLLRQESTVKLMEDELELLWLQCSAHTRYEKSGKAPQLPPLSGPLPRLPELPAALRRELAAVGTQHDYVLQ